MMLEIKPCEATTTTKEPPIQIQVEIDERLTADLKDWIRRQTMLLDFRDLVANDAMIPVSWCGLNLCIEVSDAHDDGTHYYEIVGPEGARGTFYDKSIRDKDHNGRFTIVK